MEDLSGKQLGPYRVVGPLGKGGMASVFKAFHAAMDRYVALKVLPRHLASEPEFVARFQQEARVVAKLQHPHILPVHDFGEAEGYTYLVMPFVQGGTLAALLRESAPLPLERIRPIMAQLGDALDYAHERGVIHRDVKPSNVLLDERGHCLLTDFGLAKILEGSDQLTASGAFVGTPAYMSPEQGLGKPADARSDLYALGVILYEMVTGHTPYQAETPMAVVIKHINAPLPPPSSINPNVPEAIERVILKAMAKDPADRYATASQLAQATQAALTGQAYTPPATPTKASSPATADVDAPANTTQVHTPPSGTSRHPQFSFWGAFLGSGLWWGVASLGLSLLSLHRTFPGGAMLGFVGAWVLTGRWRRLNPQVSSRRRLAFLAVGAVGGAIAMVSQGGAFVLLPLLWVVFGLLMRPLEPQLSWGRLIALGFSWLGFWIGGLLFASLGLRIEQPVVSAFFVAAGLAVAGGLSTALTLALACPASKAKAFAVTVKID